MFVGKRARFEETSFSLAQRTRMFANIINKLEIADDWLNEKAIP